MSEHLCWRIYDSRISAVVQADHDPLIVHEALTNAPPQDQPHLMLLRPGQAEPESRRSR